MKDEGEEYTVSGNQQQADKLAGLMVEIIALLTAQDVNGIIVLALPGNAEVRIHLDADWSAVYMKGDQMMFRDCATMSQISETCNVLSLLSHFTGRMGEDLFQARSALLNASGMELVERETIKLNTTKKVN